MPTPRATRDKQLSLRAEERLVERIDNLRVAMKRKLRGLEVSRSDLLKTLVEQALPLMEMEYQTEGYPDGVASHEEIAAMVNDTIRILLDLAESRGVELDLPGYVIKPK